MRVDLFVLSTSFIANRSQYLESTSFGGWFLGCSGLGDQNHAEACLPFHHACVSIGCLLERKCLDHWANILQDTEGQGVLAVNRRAGQASVDRTPPKDERENIKLDGVSRCTHHDELAAGGKTRHELRHRIATGSGCKNRSCAATDRNRCPHTHRALGDHFGGSQ